ncbi:MAG: hypothetical protein ACR2GD_09020 [Pyrinomonadaceae bacterium]
MTNSNEIHRSFVEADDIEEISASGIPIGEIFRNLLRHPGQIITRWNWKVALLGALLRASFYVTIYQVSKETWLVTLTATFVELGFRFLTTGVTGSIVQSFRRATPAWLATLIITITLPAFSHLVEFISHYAQETYFDSIFAASVNNSRQRAFIFSVLLSVVSAMFNLFIMQHGVLLVRAGAETKSLGNDLKRIPRLVIEFIAFLPKMILKFIGEGKHLSAAGVFLSFGLTLGALMGVMRGKWLWAWGFAVGAWTALLFTTFIVAVTLPVIRRRRETLES